MNLKRYDSVIDMLIDLHEEDLDRYRTALRRQAKVVQRLRRENEQLRCTRTAAHVTIRRPGPTALDPEEIWDGE